MLTLLLGTPPADAKGRNLISLLAGARGALETHFPFAGVGFAKSVMDLRLPDSRIF